MPSPTLRVVRFRNRRINAPTPAPCVFATSSLAWPLSERRARRSASSANARRETAGRRKGPGSGVIAHVEPQRLAPSPAERGQYRHPSWTGHRAPVAHLEQAAAMPENPGTNVKAIFIAALDRDPGSERAAYLDAACGRDADLRRQVDALLAAHDRANDDLGRESAQSGEAVTLDSNAARHTVEATIAQTPKSPEAASAPVAITAEFQGKAGPGVTIAGRYTLLEKIGEGGMGEVWVAKQSEPVKRKVALKLIKPGMDSRAVLARFEQERQALAMMDHPNIARVLDGGMTPNGQPFFVMDLVNGLTLIRFCDQAKLTPRERLELFVPICQAVQHAHQKGIVHRDLKPANIVVALIDGKPAPKVIDFGVAKATGGKLTDESMSTQIGSVVGTLEYMSPEQAGFSGIDVDTRADIYSLGVLLYELLTGLRPIDAKRLKEAALTEMIRIIQQEEPQKPSTRLSTDESLPSLAALRHIEPRKLTALLRGELDWVVMKCLEKQRDRRYETASGLARDIQRYLANEPVEARPPSMGYRMRKFLTRHKGPALAAAVMLLALVGSVAVSSTAAVLIWREQKRTEVERAKATENADAAIKVVNDLSAYVHSIEFSGGQATATAEQRKKGLDATLASYQRLLALHPGDAAVRSNVARMHRYRANLSRSLNETDAAAESYREAIRQYGELAAAYPDATQYRQGLSETSRDFGLFLSRIGRLEEATEILDQSVRVYEELRRSKPDDAGYQRVLANILIDRSELDYQLGRFPDCERTARESVDLYAHLAETPGSHPETLDPLFHGMAGNRLAMVLREQGRINEAVAAHNEVVGRLNAQVKVSATRDFLHARHRFLAERAWTLAGVPNRGADAIADLDDAILGWEKLAKQFPDSPLYLQYQGVGTMYRGRLKSLLGQRDAAATDLNAAAKILAALAEKYKDILVYRYDLGRSYIALGELASDPGEAAQWFRKARDSLQDIVRRNPEHFQYRKALEELDTASKARSRPAGDA
jgi:serine/threonine protein kinase/tetratricopeptide (TPR) repeat protein